LRTGILRDERSPIRVLHKAVRLAGIAGAESVLPQLAGVPAIAYDRALP